MSKSISVIEANNLYRELHKHFLLMKTLKDPSGYFCLVLSALKNVIYRQTLKDPSGYFCLVLSALKNVIYRQTIMRKSHHNK